MKYRFMNQANFILVCTHIAEGITLVKLAMVKAFVELNRRLSLRAQFFLEHVAMFLWISIKCEIILYFCLAIKKGRLYS